MYRKLIAVFLAGTSLSACAGDRPPRPTTAPVAQAPRFPHITPLTDIPSCMALHDKLPDFYEEPPLALLANNNTATPAEAGALVQCHEQGIVPQRAAFVERLSYVLPGAGAIASAAFPAQDQATLRVVRREMTWGQYAADYSNRSHETIAAVMAYKQQAGQANAQPIVPQQTQCRWIGSTLNCNTF